MKNPILITLLFLTQTIAQKTTGQQVYSDFEGVNVLHFGSSTGNLDPMVKNPSDNYINNSAHCLRYNRDVSFYDYTNIYPDTTLSDITPYASNAVSAPKIKMKLYSTAPVGTIINLQLGSKRIDNYPSGIHSEYTAMTTVHHAWENITFIYYKSPEGGFVSPTDIDKIVILFHPNSSELDTIYIDNLSGPELINGAAVLTNDAFPPFKLYQNYPNPAQEKTTIDFLLNASAYVSLKICDGSGIPISTLLDQKMEAGEYAIPVETFKIPGGTYYYVLRTKGFSQYLKMIVSK